jgi:N-acyl-D-amino-acid deacylase
MENLLIRNGLVVDGSGSPAYRGDVLIQGDSIAEVGHVTKSARRVIDAEGMAVCPGFIDLHTHADMGILACPGAPNYVMQGVTTAVTGNCGLTLAPCSEKHLADLERYLRPFLPSVVPAFTWKSFGDFLAVMEEARPAINLVPLVGHGTLRIAVMGFENRLCTERELETMKDLLDERLREGCHGLSTGLIYPPGSYSNLEELEALFSVLERHAAFYSSHLRSEGRHLEESVREAIHLAGKYGVSVELSHHKACPQPNWGKVKRTLALIREARSRGVEVRCDAYPYDGTSTTVTALLPPETLEGGVPRLLARIADPEERKDIIRKITAFPEDEDSFIRDVGWDNIYIVSCPKGSGIEGKALSSVVGPLPAESQAERFLEWLLSVEGEALMVSRSMSEADVERVLRDPDSIIASDSWVSDPEAPGKCHPRAYGTFPRLIGHYAREKGLMPLEKAVQKVTGLPAAKIGLKDRGQVVPGMKADLALFDPERFLDTATYADPKRYPAGLHAVVINGEIVVEHGENCGTRPGKVIRKNRR